MGNKGVRADVRANRDGNEDPTAQSIQIIYRIKYKHTISRIKLIITLLGSSISNFQLNNIFVRLTSHHLRPCFSPSVTIFIFFPPFV